MAAEVLNQPTPLADFSPEHIAPAGNDGSFLVEKNRVTPIDELTGLPLPIMPTESFTPKADMHHHFHPRRSPLLSGLGGQAVRCVRLQKVNYDTHHFDYHNNFSGPPLPKTDEDKFFTVLMAIAYVPDHAIDFSSGSPIVRKMTSEQRKRLRSPKHMRVNGEKIIHEFIKDHILAQNIKELGLSDSLLDEFKNTRNHERRMELGHLILGFATGLATESLEPSYQAARRAKLILPGLPVSAQRFTKERLGPRQARDHLIPLLYKRVEKTAA